MKKFLLKLVPFAALMLAVFVLCAVIDPFNVFHAQNIRATGVEPNKNYIKMSYILKNPDKFNAYAFGSSRVGYIQFQDVTDVHCYNMTSDGAIPCETLGNLRTFIKNGIIPERVYLGVDSLSYTESAEKHKKEPIYAPYEYLTENPLRFFTMYCDPAMVGGSVAEVMLSSEHTSSERDYQFYEYGTLGRYLTPPAMLTEDTAYPAYGPVFELDGTLADIRDIKRLCDDNGIELVLFTNPMNRSTLEDSITKLRYYDFLRGLSDISPFYNFSGFNERSRACYFIDPSHFCFETGDLMIITMTGGEIDGGLYAQGFGWYVTPDSVEDLIALTESQRNADYTKCR